MNNNNNNNNRYKWKNLFLDNNKAILSAIGSSILTLSLIHAFSNHLSSPAFCVPWSVSSSSSSSYYFANLYLLSSCVGVVMFLFSPSLFSFALVAPDIIPELLMCYFTKTVSSSLEFRILLGFFSFLLGMELVIIGKMRLSSRLSSFLNPMIITYFVLFLAVEIMFKAKHISMDSSSSSSSINENNNTEKFLKKYLNAMLSLGLGFVLFVSNKFLKHRVSSAHLTMLLLVVFFLPAMIITTINDNNHNLSEFWFSTPALKQSNNDNNMTAPIMGNNNNNNVTKPIEDELNDDEEQFFFYALIQAIVGVLFSHNLFSIGMLCFVGLIVIPLDILLKLNGINSIVQSSSSSSSNSNAQVEDIDKTIMVIGSINIVLGVFLLPASYPHLKHGKLNLTLQPNVFVEKNYACPLLYATIMLVVYLFNISIESVMLPFWIPGMLFFICFDLLYDTLLPLGNKHLLMSIFAIVTYTAMKFNFKI